MDAREAADSVERELLILTRHHEMTSPRRTRGGDALDRSAYLLLHRLSVQGPMSIADLVEAFGLAPSTLTRQTSSLLKDGLVEQTLDPSGGVARKFRITPHGGERLAADRDEITTGLAKVFEDWTPEELHRFAADLTRFNQSIERLTGRPWPR